MIFCLFYLGEDGMQSQWELSVILCNAGIKLIVFQC